MIKEELKQKIEEVIENNINVGDLTREEVEDTVFYTFMYAYWRDEIQRDELLDIMEYLEFWADMEQIDKLKESYKKRLAKRKLAKEKRQRRWLYVRCNNWRYCRK